ncbi:isochorismatase family protein [Nocardia sp. NBC_00416]|uniref:isochorismatase family protein n=1 Tax=Nocardia sp. NBC_00416 TaxID=2975991 RepID=UPI002E1F6750
MPLSTLDALTALVAVDLQSGALSRPVAPHPVDTVIARTAELAAAFRSFGLPVVLVRMTAAADGADATPGRTDMSAVARQQPAPPEGWDEIAPGLAGHPADLVVTKRTWGAFHGTDLDLQLRRRGVTQIVLTGIATSLGVESTARSAHEHGYHVTLAVDAMTDIRAASHENSIERIFPLLGETGSTGEILDLLRTSRPGAS